MSVKYAAVKWNANKCGYDLAIVASVLMYLAVFFVCGKLLYPEAEGISDAVLLMRALGTCGILMLHVVLCLGPLARLDRRLLPLVYNRRHLGVATFLVGLLHGALATGYYHGFGRVNPLLSLLTSNTNYSSWRAFPFETLGMAGLVILFLLASISHDFWQKHLGPSVWKSLHMLVYVAYGLLILHVGLGALQAERSPVYPALLALGLATVTGLHLAVGWRERQRDEGNALRTTGISSEEDNWIDVAGVAEILDCRAKVVCLPGRERVAIFRYGDQISAVTNVCAHQRGPLGEGKIVDGCITCPWHGWQYQPEDGQSPPPFHERIATYRVRVENGRFLLNPQPLPPGTPVKPAVFEEHCHDPAPAELTSAARADEFFIGWLPLPRSYARATYTAAAALVALMVVAAVTLARQQQSPGTGAWETTTEVELTGVAVAEPYALLRIAASESGPGERTVLLVEEGKFGAQQRVRHFHNQRVSVRGTILRRDGRAILELSADPRAIQLRNGSPGEFRSADRFASIPPRQVVLTGEVIDPKCYLGAMKPGGGKTHKACAARVFAAGFLPCWLRALGDGQETYYLLVTEDGGAANELALPYLGDRVTVTAPQKLWGDVPVLFLGRQAIRRL